MDCGIPFCHSGTAGCPLGNLIPEWNDLVRRGDWAAASDRLHATNNFPEFTGKLCPAPCEAACVLAISPDVRRRGGDQAGRADHRRPVLGSRVRAAAASGGVLRQRVAVVGSGPAGLAAAQQLTRAGHEVTVFERDDRLGGLLRYGIPEFKMEKSVLDRRLAQLRAEGTQVRHRLRGRRGPRPSRTCEPLRRGGARGRRAARPGRPGDPRPRAGRRAPGDGHLVPANRDVEGDGPTPIDAAGKHVVIIGGGDTGADCYGTATRQGALAVTQLDQYPEPPDSADDDRSPWPTWP